MSERVDTAYRALGERDLTYPDDGLAQCHVRTILRDLKRRVEALERGAEGVSPSTASEGGSDG